MLEFLGVSFLIFMLLVLFCGQGSKSDKIGEIVEGIMKIGSLTERQHDYLLELERQGQCEYSKTKIYEDYMELVKKGEEMEAERKDK